MASPLHRRSLVKVGRARSASTSAGAEVLVEGAREPGPSRSAKSVFREPPEGSALDALPAEASGGRVAAKPSPDRERNPRSPAAPSARGRSACPPRPAPTPAWAGPERLTPSEHPARTPPRRRIGSPGLCALPVQRDEGSMGAVWRGDGRNVWRGRIARVDVWDFSGLGAEVPVHPRTFLARRERGTMRSMVERETQVAMEKCEDPFEQRLLPLRPGAAGPPLPPGEEG